MTPLTVEDNGIINKGIQGCRRAWCWSPAAHMAHSAVEHFSRLQPEAGTLGLHWDGLYM